MGQREARAYQGREKSPENVLRQAKQAIVKQSTKTAKGGQLSTVT